jgi:membrane protease YdiL (CAAX protease family)
VPLFVLYLLFINGFGEETGWRGFAQERLQARHGPVRATLLVTLGWAGWHLPLFVILDSYRDFDPAVLPGFLLGLAAGSFVLARVYNAGGGSVAAAACWHAAYNLGAAPVAVEGTTAAIVTTAVMAYAVFLLLATARARRRGQPPPLLAGRPDSPPVTGLSSDPSR